MTLNLIPFILSREWNNDGKMLSGGRIYTYAAGTSTPKATYKKADGSELNTNPIVCDASGAFTCFLGQGSYRILITDANDVQVMPAIDGVMGSGGGIGSTSTGTISIYKTYSELRTSTTISDSVYVCGRAAEGDGGEGLFQYIPGSSLVDDDAVVLCANGGANVYKRVFDSAINPLWKGLKYNVSIDQKLVIDSLMLLSVKYGLPVLFTDSVFINQSTTIPSGASIDMSDNGYFNSTLTTSIQFSSGSKFKATGRSFGVTVNPYFDTDTVDAIRLSWMAGNTDDERLLKLFNSGVSYYVKMIVDETVTVASGTWSCINPISFESGSIISFTTGSNLSLFMPRIDMIGVVIFQIPANISISSINFGDNPAYIEWFGGVGNDSNDDSYPLYQASMSGSVKTIKGKTYKIGAATPPSYPAAFSISGDGIIKLYSTKTLGTGSLLLKDVTILLVTPHTWFAGTSLTAINATFSNAYTATTKFIDSCTYYDDANQRFPVIDGKPSIYNAHLPLLPSTQLLGTDSLGKIQDATKNLTLHTITGDNTSAAIYMQEGQFNRLQNQQFWPVINAPTGTPTYLLKQYSYNLIDNSAGVKTVVLTSATDSFYFKCFGKVGTYGLTIQTQGSDVFFNGSTSITIPNPATGVPCFEAFRYNTTWYLISQSL